MLPATRNRLLLFLCLVSATASYWLLGLDRYLSLAALQASRDALRAYYDAHPLLSVGGYLCIYIAATALSFPGATVLTLGGAAVFGWMALPVVSVASTVGATLAFLSARYLFRDWVQGRYGQALGRVNEGFAREGVSYLFGLRLVPVFPFFLVNMIMGLTPMRVWTYFWVSMLGMFPGTVLYVLAGFELASITSLRGIISPRLLVAFALLGVFPVLARHGLAAWRRRRG